SRAVRPPGDNGYASRRLTGRSPSRGQRTRSVAAQRELRPPRIGTRFAESAETRSPHPIRVS
ncbi:MAG: hypothetical protein KAI66_22090, partial [Lentisphaeria bacterium]|nr:hypothetical protein [Lentisphaeria bacterium]